MSSDHSNWHFTAELHLLPTEQGGRKTAFLAGKSLYRPQFFVSSLNVSTTCFVDKIEGKESMEPGETGMIEARLLKPEFFVEQLKPGARFEIHEGSRCVGWGTIRKVGDLEAS